VNVYLNIEKSSDTGSLETASDLPQLEGVDVHAGLGAVNNDYKLYRKLLFNFHNRHQGIKTEIRSELEHGDLHVAQRLAHTIKGVAGTVGAKRLSEISSQLESAIKNEDSNRLPNLLNSFGEEVTRVMAVLDAFVKNENAGRTEVATGNEELEIRPLKAVETSRFAKLFQDLSDLIDERDADVINLVTEIKTMLGPSNISDNFLQLESHLNSFKFEQAQKALEQMIKELGL
jgi:polar amino acid transport system substrate-binding protein